MKHIWKYLLPIVSVGLLLFASQCNTTPIVPSVTRYSYLDPIVNPPDTFQIVYNISSYGDKLATVNFQDSAVWQIKLLGDGRALFGFIDPKDSSWHAVSPVDTLGYKGSVDYTFVANNNNTDGIQNYFVEFTKLPIAYSTFSKKY